MTNLQPTPEVDWQQPLNISVDHHNFNNLHIDYANKTTEKTQGYKNMQLPDVTSDVSNC